MRLQIVVQHTKNTPSKSPLIKHIRCDRLGLPALHDKGNSTVLHELTEWNCSFIAHTRVNKVLEIDEGQLDDMINFASTWLDDPHEAEVVGGLCEPRPVQQPNSGNQTKGEDHYTRL